jgi:acyl-CoA thioesterase 8
MSDSFFIGTVARVHGLPRDRAVTVKAYLEPRVFGGAAKTLQPPVGVAQGRPEIGMMVSLDHTIYFHSPRGFRADEWLLTEAESPWAGDGRGLVMQKIWTREGKLVATCFQEVSYVLRHLG